MSTPICERAIEDALQHGNALLKFISPNNVGLTGGHECGFYLPISVWEMYTPHGPVKGRNDKHPVSIVWQDGRTTESVITWYGAAKHEYRLTRFGKDFPFLNEDVVGDLLVLIAKSRDEFLAYVLDYDEDIEDIQSALGVEAFETWGVYRDGVAQVTESEDECIDRKIREFSAALDAFPTGEVFSQTTRGMLADCLKQFAKFSPDDALMRAYQTEYQFFQSVERQVCQNEVSGRLFKSIDDFLHTAASIMNRRKARAGRSFENHVEHLLLQAGIPHKMRPALGVDGRPDIVIPGEKAYFDPAWPEDRLFVVGLKTTCKDRWRQVLNEGRRVHAKHILTLQQGISAPQLQEMHTAGVSLVVPQALHKSYPKDGAMPVLSIETFLKTVKDRLH
jgi:type II restriction enzyme